MRSINVINEIKPFLVFNNEDDFYYLQIIQRRKENPNLESNNRVIKNYYINSLEYLESRYEEIKALCYKFNARASLRLNKRSYKKVSFKTLQKISNLICSENYNSVYKSYDRSCGNGHNDENKKWILDIDYPKGIKEIKNIKKFLKTLEPEIGSDKTLMVLPTKNGFHIITKPFNVKKFKEVFPEIDIHKDNPINLFIP